MANERPANFPDDSDLLAWVEGESLSADAAASISRAMKADPAFARRMELMRADRAALCALADESAPEDLLDSVDSALQPVLERELLLGLKDGEPLDSRPVVSMVRPEKRGIFQTFLADRAGRRMALAASLLVLVGGATWYAAATFTGGPKPSPLTPGPISPIALNDHSSGNHAGKMQPEPAATLADASSKMAASTGAPASSLPESPGAGLEAPFIPEVQLATADSMGPERPLIDSALAADLARERKLVIRVVSQEASVAPRRVCDRIRKECNSSGWRLAGQVPQELAVALDAKPLDPVRSVPSVRSPEPPAYAGAEAHEPLIGPPAPVDLPVIAEDEPQPVYLVQARLDPATLAQLKASLERAGRGDEVILEERYEPLPLSESGTPVFTPQAILWWTNPPSGWTSWGEVPVVIEPR